MKDHDVRHLALCDLCRKIGDDRALVCVASTGRRYHGRCALKALGVDGLLALPKTERGKITLSEVGSTVMRRLIETDEDRDNYEPSSDGLETWTRRERGTL